MQRYLLDSTEDPRLKVYIVWGPMLGGETQEDAREATALVPDSRATHYWTGSHALAEALGVPAGLKEELAWDTFLLFPAGSKWGGVPPRPDSVMHVGKRSLPAERRLNGERLRDEVRKLRSAP